MSRIDMRAIARGVTAALLLGCSASVGAAPSPQFSISGVIQNPATYTAADLQSLPPITQTVSYGAGSSSQTHTYVGPSTWSLLDTAGVIIDPATKNDILNKYVIATGSDGYRSVFSLGELNPNFGNRPSIIAHSEVVNGNLIGLGNDGAARITAPGDVKGGRYVSNLVNLEVRDSGSTQTGIGGGISTQFKVSGAVNQGKTFTLADLLLLPAQTRVVGTSTYVGVSLYDLLYTTVGLKTDPNFKNDILNMYAVATGSDGYQTVLSLGELDPGFGNQPDIIAYELNGDYLTTSGFARLVLPNDVKAGRYVSNLVSIEVFSAARVPEPHTLALLSVGVLVLVRARARR